MNIGLCKEEYFVAVIYTSGLKRYDPMSVCGGESQRAANRAQIETEIDAAVGVYLNEAHLMCMCGSAYEIVRHQSADLGDDGSIVFYIDGKCGEGEALLALAYATALIQRELLTKYEIFSDGFITKGSKNEIETNLGKFGSYESEVIVDGFAFSKNMIDSMMRNGFVRKGMDGEIYVQFIEWEIDNFDHENEFAEAFAVIEKSCNGGMLPDTDLYEVLYVLNQIRRAWKDVYGTWRRHKK